MQNRSLDDQTIVRLVLDPAEIGGAVIDVDVLDRALGRRHDGLQIHRLYFSATEDAPRTEQIGTSAIHWHPVPYDKATTWADQPRLVASLRDAFGGLVDVERPALFVNHVPENPSGIYLSQIARARGLPVLAVFHGGDRPSVTFDVDHARSVDVVAANLRASSGLADAVGAVSDSASRMMPMTFVSNLGTAADAALFDPAVAEPGYLRGRFGFPASLPVFLLSGRIVPEKGHLLLLEASQILFRRSVDHRIVFAGSASPRTRLDIDHYLKANDLRDIVGLIYDASQREMVSIYRDADVVVLPTYHFEGCPRCLIEAGLMERPVVASDAGGAREAFLPGESGLLVPVGDVAALAAALEALGCDPERRTAMGQAGRRFAAARFDPDALASRHEAAYAALLGSRHG